MALGNILIVVPETDLRRSLRFLLEAEGYAVDDLPGIDTPPLLTRYDCTVLDRRAAIGSEREVIDFCRRSAPVILLSDVGISWLAGWITTVVELPVAGLALVSAVAAAIADGT